MNFLKQLFGRSHSRDTIVDHESLTDLNSEEQGMIQGIVELSETTIKEVIIPRIDVVFIDVDSEQEDLFEILTQSGHSRFPVYQDTIDNVVGVLYVKDLLEFMTKKESFKSGIL